MAMHLNCQFSYSKLATYALSSRGWFVKYAIIFLKKLVDIFLNGSTTLMSFNALFLIECQAVQKWSSYIKMYTAINFICCSSFSCSRQNQRR